MLRLDDTDARALAAAEFAAADRGGSALARARLGPMLARQSDRLDALRAPRSRRAARARPSLYPCYETRGGARSWRASARLRAPAGRRVYDRAGAAPDAPPSSARLEAEGRAPHWRFRLPDGGERRLGRPHAAARSRIDLASSSAIRCCMRADGDADSTRSPRWSTTSSSASRHVIRGEDHVTNTALQIAHRSRRSAPGAAALRPSAAAARRRAGTALEARWAASSSRAAARERRRAAGDRRAAGARSARRDAVEPAASARRAGRRLRARGASAARRRGFDSAELDQLNARARARAAHAAVAPRLAALGMPSADERVLARGARQPRDGRARRGCGSTVCRGRSRR